MNELAYFFTQLYKVEVLIKSIDPYARIGVSHWLQWDVVQCLCKYGSFNGMCFLSENIVSKLQDLVAAVFVNVYKHSCLVIGFSLF